MINHYKETLNQALTVLQLLSDDDYTVQPKAELSSIGAHIRHIIDHFNAVRLGLRTGVVDYERRSRGGELERDKKAAVSELTQLIAWLDHLQHETLFINLNVRAEISVGEPCIANAQTSLNRELMFVASHAVHHYALVNIILHTLGYQVGTGFGVAASTFQSFKSQ